MMEKEAFGVLEVWPANVTSETVKPKLLLFLEKFLERELFLLNKE
jgi:hypothetical protein